MARIPTPRKGPLTREDRERWNVDEGTLPVDGSAAERLFGYEPRVGDSVGGRNPTRRRSVSSRVDPDPGLFGSARPGHIADRTGGGRSYITTSNYKAGGLVRGDGCAVRGKTKGKNR